MRGTGSRRRLAFVLAGAAFAVWAIVLLWTSTPRVVGDGLEYVAMAQKIASGRAPSLTLREAMDLGFEPSTVRARDNWRECIHFWFYPALVAPVLWLTGRAALEPLLAFTVVNALLMAVVCATASTRLRWPGALFLATAPIWWWVDKPHSEVFTFGLLSLGFLWLPSRPHWSLVAIAVASTQNPPIAGLLPLVALHGWWFGRVDRRAWRVSGILAVGLALLSPVYYWLRLRRWSPLVSEDGLLWPTLDLWGYVVWDPNLGLVFGHPWSVALLWLGVMVLAVHWRRGTLDAEGWSEIGIATSATALFLFAFAQTGNLNHGATVGMSRYALWLLPLGVPLWRALDRLGSKVAFASGAAIAVVSAVWTLAMYRPALPEQHLRPSRAALALWTRHPAVNDPLPEIFYERVAGSETPIAPASTPGCEKVLLVGGVWPNRCAGAAEVPATCGRAGAWCYANLVRGRHVFTRTTWRGAGRPWSLLGW
jgi:hypothetical protein